MVRGSPNREGADPDVVDREDDDGAVVQIVGYLIEVIEQSCGLMLRTAVALTEQHKARQRQALLGEKLTEIGVRRHQDPLLVKCCGQHLVIDMARKTEVNDMDDVVSGFGKEWCKPSAEALVEQEPHADVRSGTCRSLTAMAANSSAARTSSSESCG